MQFQSFHHAIQNWAKSSMGGREPRLSDSYVGADSLWSKAMFRAANFDTTDVAWSAATAVKATSGSAARSALSADEVASIIEGIQQGQLQSPATGGTDSPGKEARGDGIRKHKGLHDFPVHLDYKLVCNRWMSGATCPFGAECNKYCYFDT